jgi:hypothetical protein
MDFFMSSSRLIPPETFTARQRMRTAHVRFPWRPRHRLDRIGPAWRFAIDSTSGPSRGRGGIVANER